MAIITVTRSAGRHGPVGHSFFICSRGARELCVEVMSFDGGREAAVEGVVLPRCTTGCPANRAVRQGNPRPASRSAAEVAESM